MENKNVLSQIVDCGKLIEKKREHFKKIEVDENVLLKGLTEKEQEDLSEILTKMKEFWISAHKARVEAEKEAN